MQLFIKKILIIGCVLFFNSLQPLCNQIDCPLLYCDSLDVQIHAGISPTIWHADSVGIPAIPTIFNPLLQISERPSFKTVFEMPWIVGMQIGYAYNECIRYYVECNYVQAKGKNEVLVTSITTPPFQVKLSPEKFRLVDAYVGSRFYWGRWYNQLAFFLGAKIGAVHHYPINFTINVAPASLIENLPLLKANTFVSGGINGGADICVCDCLSLVITAEVIFSHAPKSEEFTSNVIISGRFNSIALGNTNMEIRFPITAGLRYSF